MSLLFAMRFDFRNPASVGTTAADRYEAAIEMAEWAEYLDSSKAATSLDVQQLEAMPLDPVAHVSLTDLRGFLAWRNRRAEAAHEAWRFDLPTGREWEQAARGADARAYPWGDDFDFSLCLSAYRKPYDAWLVAGADEPLDESPLGVLNLAGSLAEPTLDPAFPNKPVVHGASWCATSPTDFRSATRDFNFGLDQENQVVGARLVAHRVP